MIKSVEKRLRQSEDTEGIYRTIFQNSSDAVILTDTKGRFMEINQAAIHILGYDNKEELLALKSVFHLFEAQEDIEWLRKSLSQDGSVIEFETCLVEKQGRAFDALITSNVVIDTNGANKNYIFIIRDITKINRAQYEIERRNIRLAALNAISATVSSSLDLQEVLDSTIDKILEILEADSMRIYLLDDKKDILNLVAHKGHLLEFIEKNHMKCREVGDGLLGKTVWTCKTRVVDNLMRSEDPYVDSFIEEGLQATVYIPLISKDIPVGVMSVSSHSQFKFSLDYVEFLTAIGNQIGVAVDNANLYKNLERAYQELKEAQEQVIRAEKLASLGKLAATIAHEINNPLAAVLTYIRLMMKLMKRGRFTSERIMDISRYLDTMESETARCGEIVKNLLTFSRQSKMIMETNMIEEIIEKTLVLIAHDLKMKAIKIVKEIEPDLPKIRCDFKQIQQALLNLISNASESMSNEGALTVSARHAKQEDVLEIVISDTGRGIPDEDLKNIFEPFFTTKEEGKGVGLGLSVVYGIITRHNGTLEVESRFEEGSAFKIRLPIVQ